MSELKRLKQFLYKKINNEQLYVDDTNPTSQLIYRLNNILADFMNSEVEALQPKEKASDWAMVVLTSIDIFGRGRINSGRLLYGTPKIGDCITYVDSVEDELEVRGIESSTANSYIGIIMDRRVVRGTCLLGTRKS